MNRRRQRPAWSPRARACSSPSSSRSSREDTSRVVVTQTSTGTAMTSTCSHRRLESPPMLQNMYAVTWYSLETERSSDVAAPNSALTAIPLITSVTVEVRPPRLPAAADTARIRATAPRAPRKDAPGRRYRDVIPAVIDSRAPNPLPADTPSRPGSARGLRNTPCITAPDRARPLPANSPQRTRGRRMETTTA